ncbi:hypothetical protein EDD21DRAFT_204197 [Dissophora ornata]|nr:hypothetical protein BGZ58_009752 [Dissophora ornata]KAI8606507.1 hypothetical protein EDD21DRAFT_204197 [Dissophora ornata]
MVSLWPHHNTEGGAQYWLLIVFICNILSILSQPTEANIFGVVIAQLGYDIVSVQNNPTNINTLGIIMGGNDLPVGVIADSASIPKSGLSGVLYDMGYACQPGFDPNTTLPTPNLYGLPKIALIRRGGPTNETACTFRLKLLNAQGDGAIAAIVFNGYGQGPIDGATAATNDSDAPVNIPGMFVTYDSGMMLRSFLPQSNTTNTTAPNFYNRVRVNIITVQKMPIIWEIILIVVVVFLGISFTVSVILHCRLYTLRRRYRAEALARGGDVLPNGTIRIRKTLEKAQLDEFPVRIYEQGSSSTSAVVAGPLPVSTPMSTTLQDQTEKGSKTDSVEPAGTSSEAIRNSSDSFRSEPKSLSRANSISGRSVRSVAALAAAEALDAGARTEVPNQQFVNETCAICLDDFSEGEEIRTLPCHHEFHCECIDPWLTRKSSTCPLCKYECLLPTAEEDEEGGESSSAAEGSGVVVPNDHLMEFIMGPEWVAARTQHHHNGTSTVDRVGNFFSGTMDRIRGRPPRPSLAGTVPPSSSVAATSTAAMVPQVDENGEVPLQLITPRGVTAMPLGRQGASQESTVVISIPPLDEIPPPPRVQVRNQQHV